MVHFSENEGIENRRFVVTGGAGFVGRALCLELVRRGAAEVGLLLFWIPLDCRPVTSKWM